jgi:hypothetical protein
MKGKPAGSLYERIYNKAVFALSAVVTVVAILVVVSWVVGVFTDDSSTNPSHLTNRDYAYWYCWNTGEPRPHHLGHRSVGDHVCSEEELSGATLGP